MSEYKDFICGGHKKASGGRVTANLKIAKKRVLLKLTKVLS